MFISNDLLETRSDLYNIEPKGIGTPEVESLTSYLTRLATAHNITTGKLLRYLSENELVNTNMRSVSTRSAAYNGNGENNKQITYSLEKLTGRSDLKHLSLYDFSSILQNGKELKLYKSWCPSCLLIDELKYGEVYERLIWQFEVIKLCQRHNCQLETECPRCHKQNPLLSSLSPIGYCHYCQSKLSNSYPNKFTIYQERDLQQYFFKEIGLLLSLTFKEREKLNKEIKFSNIIKNILSQIRDRYALNGNMFTNYLGIGSNQLSAWKHGSSRPSLLNLLKISYVLDTNIKNLFLNEINITNIKNFPQKYNKYIKFKNRGDYTSQEIEKNIEVVLKNLNYYEKFSLNEVANKIGYKHASNLRTQYPEIYKKISTRRLKYLEQRRKVRTKKMEDEISEAMLRLYSKGLHPTPYRVNRELEKQIVFLEPSNLAIYDKVYKEFIGKLKE